jgi:site-specific recombinase XerD
MRRPTDPLLRLVESFFSEYLRQVRSVSRHTILSYRDTLRLFFGFVADHGRRSVADLRVDDLTVDHITAFLEHLEADRGNTIATRNMRLTALRTFVRHVIRKEPQHAAECQRILSLQSKRRAPANTITYLEPEEVQVLLRQPDRQRMNELRDYALLLFLYNTGCRIGEALGLRVGELQLVRPRQVHLHGKGRKDRICPVWPNTAKALARVTRGRSNDSPVFLNACGEPLTRDGAAYILEKHLRRAEKELPQLTHKRVTPHVLRHSCAVALLQAGIDLTVIRDYLGHESVESTGRYTRANLRLKRRVLDTFWRRAGLTTGRDSRWRPSPDLIAYLTSL